MKLIFDVITIAGSVLFGKVLVENCSYKWVLAGLASYMLIVVGTHGSAFY